MDCENPECPFRKSLRRFLRRASSEGVFLQGRWYCSLDCFEWAIGEEFSAMLKLREEPLPHTHRVPLGLLLLGRGVISDEQLKSALAHQREYGSERLGRWLVRLGVASALDVSAALAAQWGCGVFPLEGDRQYRDCSHMIPLVLLESSRMIPVRYLQNNHLLFVAFAEDLDRTALYSIERLLGARTEPCFVTETAMETALEDVRATPRPGETVFETIWDAPEMARAVRSYALKLGAEELSLARLRRFLWVRIRGSGRSHDLLFRLPPMRVE